MFTRFIKEFENTIVLPAPAGADIILGDTAMLDTPNGWTSPTLLKPGMDVATLDGGFTLIRSIERVQHEPGLFFIPEGALGNCNALHMPGEAHIGFEAPLSYSEAQSDHLSLPVSALEGHFGVRRATSDVGQMYRMTLAEEEMVWTNTGCLLHARSAGASFFHTLSFGQARAFLTLLEAGHFETTSDAHPLSQDNTIVSIAQV